MTEAERKTRRIHIFVEHHGDMGFLREYDPFFAVTGVNHANHPIYTMLEQRDAELYAALENIGMESARYGAVKIADVQQYFKLFDAMDRHLERQQEISLRHAEALVLQARANAADAAAREQLMTVERLRFEREEHYFMSLLRHHRPRPLAPAVPDAVPVSPSINK